MKDIKDIIIKKLRKFNVKQAEYIDEKDEEIEQLNKKVEELTAMIKKSSGVRTYGGEDV